MVATTTEDLGSRRENGKSVRRKVPRSAHTAIGNVDRDPVDLLKISSEGRVRRLVPLRYGRMVESPFAFYRGSAIVQAHDLAGTPDSGLHMQICGDCHLANFGGFATPERALLFDVNDFDETSRGPWEWDLKRLAASFVVAARHLRHKQGVAEDLVYQLVRSYQERMRSYAQMGILDTWYDRITFDACWRKKPRPTSRSASGAASNALPIAPAKHCCPSWQSRSASVGPFSTRRRRCFTCVANRRSSIPMTTG